MAEIVHGPRLVLCLGNEAADADSIVSALCYSHIKNTNLQVENQWNLHTVFVPVVNIWRKAIHLRRDVEVLLSYSNLSLRDLICVDDLQDLKLNELSTKGKLGLILLDHNELSLYWQSRIQKEIPTSSYIDGIVDHHQDQGLYSHLRSGFDRNIAFDSLQTKALVGSCCTLVVEEMLASPHLQTLTSDIGLLLKGVILVDTINMDAKTNKGTSRDQHALDKLDELDPETASVSRNELFDKLINSKTDLSFWRSLSAEEALSLDYKDFSFSNDLIIGIASVLLPLNELITKDDFGIGIENLFETGRSIVIIMTLTLASSESPSMTRQLMILVKNSDDLLSLETLFQEKDMKLEPLPDEGLVMSNSSYHSQAYLQRNVGMSRKQVAAILQNYYDNQKL